VQAKSGEFYRCHSKLTSDYATSVASLNSTTTTLVLHVHCYFCYTARAHRCLVAKERKKKKERRTCSLVWTCRYGDTTFRWVGFTRRRPYISWVWTSPAESATLVVARCALSTTFAIHNARRILARWVFCACVFGDWSEKPNQVFFGVYLREHNLLVEIVCAVRLFTARQQLCF